MEKGVCIALAFALSMSVIIILCDKIPKWNKTRKIEKYVKLYIIVVQRMLNEKSKDCYRFYSRWLAWLLTQSLYGGFPCLKEEAPAQLIAWARIKISLEQLARYLNEHDVSINYDVKKDPSFGYIRDILDMMNYSREYDNSYERTMQKFGVRDYEVR